MGIIAEKGMIFCNRRISGSVHQGKDDCFEPCGAGFGGGNKKNIRVLSLEVFLTGNYTLEMPDGVPETLILIEMRSKPSSFFR